MTAPEHLITVIPADVCVVLLTSGLTDYRRAHRGENRRVDDVLLAMSEAAFRWCEMAEHGQKQAPNADTVTSSELLTTKQAADRARVSDRTIRRAINAGHIPAARAGRAWLVNRDDIDRYTRRMG